MNMLARHESMNREFRDFNSLMDHFLQEMGMTPVFRKVEEGGKRLQLKIDEKNVTALLPCAGHKGSDFEVDVVGDMLNVTFKCSEEKKEEKEKKYISRERLYHEFSESVRLPVPVKGQEATAKYADGVLTVTMPRYEEKLPEVHCIDVQ